MCVVSVLLGRTPRVTVTKTDGGRCFCWGRVLSRRLTEKGSRICVVCCIHVWSDLLWTYSKGGGSTKAVEYQTVSGGTEYYRENVIYSVFHTSTSFLSISS